MFSLAVPRRLAAAAEEGVKPSRGIFSCKAEGESCRGFPKCCGDLVCYWENGFSARTVSIMLPDISSNLSWPLLNIDYANLKINK